MQTIVEPAGRVDEDQRLMTDAVRPSATELVRARRQLHFKAIGIAALAIGSYWSLVMTTVVRDRKAPGSGGPRRGPDCGSDVRVPRREPCLVQHVASS